MTPDWVDWLSSAIAALIVPGILAVGSMVGAIIAGADLWSPATTLMVSYAWTSEYFRLRKIPIRG